ncbi:hypothetical protein [Pilimelia terevasa]|nr:hypothetical protein [Pilimelia terevasa]
MSDFDQHVLQALAVAALTPCGAADADQDQIDAQWWAIVARVWGVTR